MRTTTPPTLTIDVELYQHYLDDSNLTEEQKRELLETLWNIICGFVQMGFEVHPVQQALTKTSGKEDIEALSATHRDSTGLKCNDQDKEQRTTYRNGSINHERSTKN